MTTRKAGKLFLLFLMVPPAVNALPLPEIDPAMATTPLALAVISLFIAADRFRRAN